MPALRKRTRVCFPFVGDSLGGSHMSTLLLIEGLARSRYEPVLVVHEEGPLTAHLEARDIPFELLPLPTCQRRSKSTPLAGVKMHHLMRFSPALAVVPVVHRRAPRCFV